MATSRDWARAFARQAASDIGARSHLTTAALPRCHELHFLQMGLEKLSKAHLIEMGADPIDVQKSHYYIAKQVPMIVRDYWKRNKTPLKPWEYERMKILEQQIEALVPTRDWGLEKRSASNCEYPWLASDASVVAPVDHEFGISLVRDSISTKLLKACQGRAHELAKDDGE